MDLEQGIRTRKWYKDNGFVEEPEKPLVEDRESWPTAKFFGSVVYCATLIDIAISSDVLLSSVDKHDGETPLGFDMEWPFNFQTGSGKTAVIQICPDKRICYIFHVSQLSSLPKALIALLSHQQVKLCGVNIRNDIHKLARDFPHIDKETILLNCVDSRTQANLVSDLRSWSMEKLVNHFLKMQIDKSSSVRRSKWDVIPLTKEQQTYAAADAYISLVLYKHLQSLLAKQINYSTEIES